MNALRAKITLLVMGAIIAMSVIGVAAAFSVFVLLEPAGTKIVFRYSPEAGQAGSAATYPSSGLPEAIAGIGILPVDWVVLAYAVLIVSGSAAVGVIVANMILRPLAILEEAVESVGPEGFIPRLPEKGLGEDLEAAKLINRLSERLKAAMESRMRLVAAAGHDLRTPMTRMRLRTEFIEDDEERAKWTRDIDEMAHIADSAIRLVREEAGSLSSETVDLDLLLRDLCGELREIGHDIREGDIEELQVRGGMLSLKRAFSNLAVNAATHGGKAEISLARDGANAVVRIADSGPGIPEDMIPQAFEPFFRASPARQKDTPGAGLGLSIAKEIVTRQGGTVKLANRPGGGLLQTVTLPSA